MNTQVFQRHEIKFIITRPQKELILSEMQGILKEDGFGRSTIRNIYFDTDSYQLARHSIEKPVYKEKLRLRSYKKSGPEDKVFVELKKKYQSVVYKRREQVSLKDAVLWYEKGEGFPGGTQVGKELDWFYRYYKTLKPKVFLSYEREAYFSQEGNLRITFDENILARQNGLSLSEDIGGTLVLNPDLIIMELKTDKGIPLMLSGLLGREKIYKGSFSKYGSVYRQMVMNMPGHKTACAAYLAGSNIFQAQGKRKAVCF